VHCPDDEHPNRLKALPDLHRDVRQAGKARRPRLGQIINTSNVYARQHASQVNPLLDKDTSCDQLLHP
jgi:hypothetical protein